MPVNSRIAAWTRQGAAVFKRSLTLLTDSGERNRPGTDGPGTFRVTLTRRELIAESTYELEFDLLGASVKFAAGQYCRIELPTLRAPDKKNSRKFSFINAPHDNERVVIATRAGVSGFKRTLCALQPGMPATVRKVKGSLTLPERPQRPTVLIAGGIGVAPFVSILRDLDHHDKLTDMTLLYLNRDTRSAPYLAELEELSARSPGFRLVPSMTRDQHWTGETDHFGPGLLSRHVENIVDSDYYVVGSPSMVNAAVANLRGTGVSTDRIHDEDFSGYQ